MGRERDFVRNRCGNRVLTPQALSCKRPARRRFQIVLKFHRLRRLAKRNVGLDSPRRPFRGVGDRSTVVPSKPILHFARQPDVEAIGEGLALQNVDVVKPPRAFQIGLPGRSSLTSIVVQRPCFVQQPPDYAAADFALRFAASEDWRKGESNPFGPIQIALIKAMHQSKMI